MIEPRQPHSEPWIRSVVISKPGAAIRVERIELSDAARRSLTAEGVTYLPPPYIPGGRRRKK